MRGGRQNGAARSSTVGKLPRVTDGISFLAVLRGKQDLRTSIQWGAEASLP